MNWLIVSSAVAGTLGLLGLAWLGMGAQVLILPLAGLAALPLLGPYLRRDACARCRTPADAQLGFCPGCAA